MTLSMVFGLTGYLAFRIYMIEKTNEYGYTQKDSTLTVEQMNNLNVTLGRYNDSLNFIFGLSMLPANFDILNNPYFEFLGYELTPKDGLFIWEQKYEFEVCTKYFDVV